MNWEAIGAVGEVLGSIAVLLSLIYIARQIRFSSRQIEYSNLHAITDNYRHIVAPYLDDNVRKVMKKVYWNMEYDLLKHSKPGGTYLGKVNKLARQIAAEQAE